MGLRFCSFASGSSGNCYMVKSDNSIVLVDCGISGKRILAALEEKEAGPEDVSAILLTHEHSDHVQSIRTMARKAKNAVLYASEGTFAGIPERQIPDDAERTVSITEEDELEIGDMVVRPFLLSHDAIEPLGYSFESGGRRLAIVTDTGYITDEIEEHIRRADTLVLEANHEVNILRMGSYPYPLQERILGEEGHLSNEAAAEAAAAMVEGYRERAASGGAGPAMSLHGEAEGEGFPPPKVILAHLSRENNTPEQAFITIKNILFEHDIYEGEDVLLSVLKRDEPGPMIEV